MPNTSTHVESGETDGSCPGSSDGIDHQLVNYVSFRQGTYLNYNPDAGNTQASREVMSKLAQYVQRELPTDVLRTREDHQSILELATREWTGYGVPKNRNSALDRWTSLASSAPDVPRRIKAQAHSCLATGLLDQASEDPEQRDIDLLYRAGSNANEAVSLGLISPGALKVGFSIESQGFRRPKDNRLPGTDRFEQLAELWEAIDARTVEMERASGKGDGKPSKTPLKYVCSAEGCGIQATKKWGLLRCAGKCPVVFKPSYCSRECQKIDWKLHKPFCKADATKSSVRSLNSNNDTTEDTGQRAKDTKSDKSEGRSPGHTTDAPARHKRPNSKTSGPQTIRELRKAVEENSR